MGLPFHLPHRTGAQIHRAAARRAGRILRFEGMTDMAVIAGVVVLAGAMIYGLLTTTGNSPWY